MPRSLRLPVVFVAALVLVAAAAPWLAPYDVRVPDDPASLRTLPPSALHPFGTDAVGRDVLTLVLYGARVSLGVAAGAVVMTLVLGTAVGGVAGMRGGWTDRVLMRALDVAMALPRVLILLAVAAFWGAVPVWGLIALVGATGWFDLARLVRGEVRALRGRDFTVAAQALGVPGWRVFTRHLTPHLLPVLAVSATLGVAQVIALEAGLSFLGLGVQPPLVSWGAVIRDGASVIDVHWWLTLFPGLATVCAVLACNALGEALRDAFAPPRPSR